MHRTSNRSKFNCNNAGHYNRIDRAIDGENSPQNYIRPIIGHCSPDQTSTNSRSLPARRASPLRSQLSSRSDNTNLIRLRIYSDRQGNQLLGTAMDAKTLITLIEAGYLIGDEVKVTGTLDGQRVTRTIAEHEFDRFKELLTA